jgi:hypothetical protein
VGGGSVEGSLSVHLVLNVDLICTAGMSAKTIY